MVDPITAALIDACGAKEPERVSILMMKTGNKKALFAYIYLCLVRAV